MADSAKNENQVELGGDELFTTAETIFVDSLASGLSIADSADKAGFSYMTGRRYHKRPEIKAAVRERSREAIQAGARVLSQRSHGAAQALADMAEDKKDANPARVAACKAVLEIGLRVVEIDGMQERLEAVEAQLAASAKAGT
jgi:phage terminase small subunit